MECCRDGHPFGRFSHLHRGSLELRHNDHWILGHLPDQGPSHPYAQFGQVSSSRKSPFKNDGGHCVLGDLQCCFGTLPQICALIQSSELYGQFLRPHGLVYALICIVGASRVAQWSRALHRSASCATRNSGFLPRLCCSRPRLGGPWGDAQLA